MDAISSLEHVIPFEGKDAEKSNHLLSRAESVSRYRQVVLTSMPLVAADFLAIAASYLVATLCTNLLIGASYYPGIWHNLLAVCLGHLMIGRFLGLFPGSGLNPVCELRNQVYSIGAAFVFLIALNGLVGEVTLNEVLSISIAFPMCLLIAPPARFCIRKIMAPVKWWGEKVIVLGNFQQVVSIYEFLDRMPQRGLKPIGIVDDNPSNYWNMDVQSRIEFLGTPNELVPLCRKTKCHWVIAALANIDEDKAKEILANGSLIPNFVVLYTSHTIPSMWAESFDVAGLTGVHIRDRLLFPMQRLLKRLSDIALSSILLVLTSPLLLVIALWVRLKSPGPIVYCHKGRIGRGGRAFGALKFRTMVLNADESLQKHLDENPEARVEWRRDLKLKKDPRIIPGIGAFLRRTSLDELPQLWNVLIGDMSLVGPRPIYTEIEVEKFRDGYPLYLRVRPGLTGLWQVTGRNHTTYEDRVRLDTYYVRNWSLWLDYFILLRTVRTVLFREGSY